MHPLSTDALRKGYYAAFDRSPPRTCQGGASHPAMVTLCQAKLRRFHPNLFGWRRVFSELAGRGLSKLQIEEWAFHGDSRAAVVVGTAPLVVAAYTDELDCTALLKLPDWVCQNYAFVRGTRLLTANSYSLEPGILTRRVARDLTEGPASLRNYSNFYPILIDLISADTERMAVRREEISEDEWARCEELGQAQFDACGGRYRDGRPARCGIPA